MPWIRSTGNRYVKGFFAAFPKPKKEEKEAAWIEPEDVDRLCIAIEHHMETTKGAVGRRISSGFRI